jgi:hypothetical protein
MHIRQFYLWDLAECILLYGIVLGFLGIGIFTNDFHRNEFFKVFKTPDTKQSSLFNRFLLKIELKLIKFMMPWRILANTP